MKKINLLPLFLLSVIIMACSSPKKTTTMLTLFVGTYTENNTQGISAYQFNTETGTTNFLKTTPVTNPSYLTLSADQHHLYAVSELGKEEAQVHAYALGKEAGSLTLLNSRPVKGAYPCFINTDGRQIYTANYGGGSLTSYALKADGSLGKQIEILDFNPSDSAYQAHLHCVRFSPDSTLLFASDLGGDRIYSFHRAKGDKAAKLQPSTPAYTEVAAGSGPRHFVFSRDGKRLYLINELSGKVMGFNYANHQLELFQTIVGDSVGGGGSADIHFSPDGNFLYTSHRLKADGLSIFRVAEDGHLTKIGYQATGIHPRNFILSPDGKFLFVACRDSNHIEIYHRNATTGLLEDTGKRIKLYHPVCLQWVK